MWYSVYNVRTKIKKINKKNDKNCKENKSKWIMNKRNLSIIVVYITYFHFYWLFLLDVCVFFGVLFVAFSMSLSLVIPATLSLSDGFFFSQIS